MKRRIIHIFTTFQILFLSGCYYDNEELLYGKEICSTEPVTYAEVSSVVASRCIMCHSQSAASGGVVLEGYDNLKTYAGNGRLLGAISHASGFSPMPKNAPQLSGCTINRIKQWIDDGSPNN
ncbi:MAG TPA: hypothetical protein VD927_06225 [Chryseosolibacter sp.]|nr:hypothetical protein [Chryseosolibacter sp.]